MGRPSSSAHLPAAFPGTSEYETVDPESTWAGSDPGAEDEHPTDQFPAAAPVRPPLPPELAFEVERTISDPGSEAVETSELPVSSRAKMGAAEVLVISEDEAPRDVEMLVEMENAPTIATDALEPMPPSVRPSQSGMMGGDDESRLRVTGRWEELIELYLKKLDEVDAPKEKAAILRQIGEVFRDRLNDASQAMDALVEALALDPFDNDTVDGLEELARKDDAWSVMLVEVDEKMNALSNDREREVKLSEHLARWYAVERNLPDLAEKYRERIRKLDPKHPMVQEELAREHYAQGQFALARDALKRAVDGVRRKERVPLYLALAGIYEGHLGDLAEGQKAYELALEIAPESRDAMAGLERLYRAQEKYRELEGILGRLAEAPSASPDARAGALLRLAELNEKHFLRHDIAAEKLEEVLRIEPTHDGALAALERCQLALRAWDALAATLDRRARLARDPSEKAEVLFRLAEVEESKRADIDAAIATYERILGLDARSALPLNELARLTEKKQDWNAAAAYRAKLASQQHDPQLAAQQLVQIGDMLSQPGRDSGNARHYYERALTIVPNHAGAWEAMQRDAERSGDLERVAYCLEQRAHVTESPRLKAQLLVELARQKKEMGSDAGAFEAYREAVEADPTNEVAAAAVLPAYAKESRWAEAAPLCELLVNAAIRDGETQRAFDLLRLAARIATKTESSERALAAAIGAFELSPDAVEGRKDALAAIYIAKDDPALLERGRATAMKISDNLADLPAQSFVHLAEIEHALGMADRAAQTLDEALARAPESPDALRAGAEIYEARGDFARAAQFKKREAEVITDDDEQRYTLFVEAGEMLAHRAGDLASAALAFEQARAIKPRDSWLLHTLLWAYGELELWEKLVETLRAIVDIDKDPVKKAKGVFTMGQAMRDKIGDPRRAAELFEETIAIDPSRLDAFERVVRIYTELKAWNDLEKSYRRMIHRTADGEVELRHALFHQLGLIYRDRIGDAERAIEAFKAAGVLKPSDENRKIVTELYVVTGRLDAAIHETRAALAEDTASTSLFATLYDLYLRQRAFDKAWCTVSVLAHLGPLTAEQRKFHDDYPPTPLSSVPGTLTPAAWTSHLLHRRLDPTLTAMFAVIGRALARVRLAAAGPAGVAAFGEPLRADHSYNAAALIEAVRNASEILGVPAPALYARKGPPAPLAVLPSPTPALSSNTEALDTLSREALAFLVGKRLAELRPELFGRAMFPTLTEMTTAVATAVRIVRGERAPDHATQRLDQQITASMSPEERNVLANAVGRATASGAKVDAKQWSQLADLSSSRAGLLLCGHVEYARRAMLQDGQSACDLPPRQRVHQLCLFAVSDELSDLRAAIGVGVRAQ